MTPPPKPGRRYTLKQGGGGSPRTVLVLAPRAGGGWLVQDVSTGRLVRLESGRHLRPYPEETEKKP